MNTMILGGGLAGLSLAHFLNQKSIILEKEERLGGLCRSFEFHKIIHDIGPHILFSKNQTILEAITSLVETNVIRRSNKIFHNGRLIKYPFENDLASLNEEEKEYCLNEFLNNPYENYEAKNMLQFFLKTFGEGITKLYLQPYNEKIWKFDSAYMDIQMVERIPKPPKEDVLKSARGIRTEGYTHQLYFHYPKKGGIQQLINSYAKLVSEKSKIINPVKIKKIYRNGTAWKIDTDKGNFRCERLINCMPLHELFSYIEVPELVRKALNELKYNSIYLIVLKVKKDNIGQNLSLNFADKRIIFHRLSKLNFLGENYSLKNNASTLLAEITYKPNSLLAAMPKEQIIKQVVADLTSLKLINEDDIIDIQLRSFKYAYVIYDLNHRRNVDCVLSYLLGLGIMCCGRFAEFEYLNMDGVIEHSSNLASRLNKST